MSSNEVINRRRSDGKQLRIHECLVGDSSGCIIFTARNDQGVRQCLVRLGIVCASRPDRRLLLRLEQWT